MRHLRYEKACHPKITPAFKGFFSKAVGQKRGLTAALARQALRTLRTFRPEELTNLVWSFARLGFHSAELLEAVGRAVPSA